MQRTGFQGSVGTEFPGLGFRVWGLGFSRMYKVSVAKVSRQVFWLHDGERCRGVVGNGRRVSSTRQLMFPLRVGMLCAYLNF